MLSMMSTDQRSRQSVEASTPPVDVGFDSEVASRQIVPMRSAHLGMASSIVVHGAAWTAHDRRQLAHTLVEAARRNCDSDEANDKRFTSTVNGWSCSTTDIIRCIPIPPDEPTSVTGEEDYKQQTTDQSPSPSNTTHQPTQAIRCPPQTAPST